MRGIMASLTMVSETSGSAGTSWPAAARPSQPSVRSAPGGAEEDKARGPGEAPDYDRARPTQETGEPGREPVASAIGEHELEPRAEPLQPAQQVAGSIGVPDVGGRDRSTEQQAAGAERDVLLAARDLLCRLPAARPPFASSSRSKDRSRPRWARLTARAGAASPPDEGGSPPTRRRSRTCACTRTPSARAERPG